VKLSQNTNPKKSHHEKPNAALRHRRPTKKNHISKLRNIIHNLDLLARLEGRKTHVRTTVTTEGIPQSTAPTRTSLALDGEVQLVQITRIQLHDVQLFICVGAALFILCLEAIG
jgi:hypothetical protein